MNYCRKFKLNAKQLRKSQRVKESKSQGLKKQDIYIVLDNVLDTYNVGSIFRLADAVAARKVYLCGNTEIPPNPRIKKASINTTGWVEWEYADSAAEAIKKVRDSWNCHPEQSERSSNINQPSIVEDSSLASLCGQSGLIARNDKKGMVIAIEQSKKSVPYDKFDYKLPVCLVVGHESYGVSKEVLETADGIVEIPMFGVNISLNVMVSLAIVLYEVIEKTQ